MRGFPESLAIAGAWGYIGRKFLDVAVRKRLRTMVYDPGPAPSDVALGAVTRFDDADLFYGQPAALFHLALHPEARQTGQDLLLARAAAEPIAILNEKPMAAPESPEDCARIAAAARSSQVLMLYDFPELFDPLTDRILDHLQHYREVRLTDIYVRRGKDRQARDNPRNYKRMVPIQYQESVHCLAWVLFLLGRLRGDLASAFEQGLDVQASAAPYQPPNPEIYPYVVDGKCSYRLSLGSLRVEGLTDFLNGAEFTKQRILSGSGDGKPLHIEVDYLEGKKRLVINGVDQLVDPAANSYEYVLRTFTSWRNRLPCEALMDGLYPNPAFARVTYQLSSALWRSSHSGGPLHFASLDQLLAFDAGFREAVPTLAKYALSR